MGKSVIIDNFDDVAGAYAAGRSIKDLAEVVGVGRKALSRQLKAAGVPIRSTSESASLAHAHKDFHWSRGEQGAAVAAKISATKRAAADSSAKGYSLNSGGYFQHTRAGPDRGRYEHVLVMEKHLGRKLLSDECVHHIDRDKTNNSINNLALMTVSAHQRLHRFEDDLAGVTRPRQGGRWIKGT